MTSIEVSELTVQLKGRVALDGIDLSVEAGELVAVVGPNGSGKSTLLRAIAGDVEPVSGAVSINGDPILGLPPDTAAARRSFLEQEHVKIAGFDVRSVVGFGAYISDGVTEPSDRVEGAMARAGVTDLADRRFEELSGGEQRRVSIARVLCQNAPVVLLDEPTDSLDLGHAHAVMRTARDEAASHKIVVSTSHDLNIASQHATRMVLLHRGRIARSGTPASVLEPKLLSEVYGVTVTVITHPTTGSPVVVSG